MTLNSTLVCLCQNICFVAFISYYYNVNIIASFFVTTNKNPHVRECNKKLKEGVKNLDNLLWEMSVLFLQVLVVLAFYSHATKLPLVVNTWPFVDANKEG